MKTPNIHVTKPIRRKWLRRILITLAVLVLLPFGLFTIGWMNRDSVLDVIQAWYRQNNTGTLTIGSVNANFLSGFPKVGFTIKDIIQTNTDTISDQFSTVQIEEAKVTIGAGNLLRGTIKFEKIAIKHAVITSEVISHKSVAYHEQLKHETQNKKSKGFHLPEWIHEDGAEFLLENVMFISKDRILNKYFNLDIHKIKGRFKVKNGTLSGKSSFDMIVNNLGFNTKKGSFFNGAHVTGNPIFTMNLNDNIIEIPEFSLSIDTQNFKLKADFDLSESPAYVFHLQNSQTDFTKINCLIKIMEISSTKNQIPGPDRINADSIYNLLMKSRNG